ncbi:MAG: nucleoside phosphorylase [Deltaproteobacteria bacterium]
MTRSINIDREEGLIRPIKRKNDPSLGPDVLLALIPKDLDYLIQYVQPERAFPHDLVFFKVYPVRGGEISFCGPFLGAPQAVMGVEKLIALGAERVWVYGWCGSLQPDLKIGDLVIPTGAISEEGTSRHYPVGDRPVTTDEALNQRIEAALKKDGCAFQRGTVWTTDAPYRETPDKVKAYRDEGVLAVDMEMSALMTLAAFRSIKLTGLLVVSDELFDLKWHTGFKDPRFEHISRRALELLVRVIVKD